MATVLIFAGLRDVLGAAEIEVELAADATVEDLLAAVVARNPLAETMLRTCRVAVDHELVGPRAPIVRGAEIAILPPVSGGHDGVHLLGSHSLLSSRPLSLADAVAAVSHEGAGGIATFIGNVRAHSRGRTIVHLEYEAYVAMAVSTMDAIAQATEHTLPGTKIAVQHRIGRLEIGESAVVVAASAAHRAEAFEACRTVIERLKKEVPIWKKEFDDQGGTWIGQGP